ncbi:MAG: ribosome maturation factor RimM [Smithellaceae bacterium]|nr:ribosome maturation factor RimM [Smithellaceae bacterium]
MNDIGCVLELGRITKTHGLRGRLKGVSCLGEDCRIKQGDELIFTFADRRVRPRVVNTFNSKGGGFYLELEGITTIEAAQELLGASVSVSRDKLEPLEEGEYYWRDLVGIEVVTEEGELLGIVDSVFPTGSNDVYVCRGVEREILLPGISEVVREIDLAKNRMIVRLMAGL